MAHCPRAWLGCCCQAAIAAALTPLGLAQDVPAPAEGLRVARLVERLGDPSFQNRATARDELLAAGAAARVAIEQAAQSPDLEVRLRAKEILRDLKVHELWSAMPLEASAAAEPASQVLKRLSASSGNELLLGDQYSSFHDKPVDLAAGATTFWVALDQICAQTGNHVRPHYDTSRPGLVVVAGMPGKNPVAYAGPVRAQISSARRVFMEDLDYETLRTETTHTFQINVQIMWEDRLQLVAYRSPPEVAEIRVGDRAFPSAPQPTSGGWNVAGSANRKLSLDLRLHPPATVTGRLDELCLLWDVIAVGDHETIEISQLDRPSTHRRDGLVLDVAALESKPGGRWDATLTVLRDLVVPEPADVLLQENEVELLDATGRAFRIHGQTNALVDGAARLKITFGTPAEDSQPVRLRLTYPRIRSQRSLEICFRDVPLPAGRPE
ncbi:MAG: hypothetical protein K1X74_11625 [Pirellulales bacterium]|nr:hypothetical protein [Pirellulales bacterium]